MHDAFSMNGKDHVCCRRSAESTAPLCRTAGPGGTENGSFTLGQKWGIACEEWQRRRKRITNKASGVRVGSRGDVQSFMQTLWEWMRIWLGHAFPSSIMRKTATGPWIFQSLSNGPQTESTGAKKIPRMTCDRCIDGSWFIEMPHLR